jgi:transposase-like protein
MAALSGEKTLEELAAEFGVHPTMISNRKQELVKRAGELFARGSKAPAAEDAQKVIDDLHRKIGQLQAALLAQRCRLPRGCARVSAFVHRKDHAAQMSTRAHRLRR